MQKLTPIPPNTPEETQQLPPAPSKWRKVGKYALIALGVIAALLIIVRLIIGSGIGRAVLETQLESRVIAGQSVLLDNLSGDLLGQFQISRLEVADKDGVWLTADNIVLDWNPWQFAFGKARVRTFTIERLDLLREPILPAPDEKDPPDQDASGDTFLKAVILDNLTLGQVHAYQTPETALSLNAALNANRKDGELALALRTNPQDDTVDLNLSWNKTRLLVGEADITIKQDGFISGFLPKPLEGDLVAAFKGEGDLDDWTGQGDIKVGADNLATLEGVSEDRRAAVSIALNPTVTSLLDMVSTRLGDTLDIELTADMARYANTPVSLKLNAPNLAANLSGAVNINNRKPRDTWQVMASTTRLSQLSGVKDLQAETVRFGGSALVNDNDIGITGNLSINALNAFGRSARLVTATLDVDQSDQTIGFDFDLKAQDTIIAPDTKFNDTYNVLARGVFDQDAGRISLERANLRSQLFNLSADGRVDLDGAFDLTGAGDIKKLVALGAPLDGATDFDFTVRRASIDDSLVATLKGDAEKLDAGASALSSLIGATAQFDIKASYAPSGDLEINADAASGPTDLSARATLNNDVLAANVRTAISDWSYSGVTTNGVRLSLNANGPTDNLILKARSDINALESSGLIAEDISLSADALWKKGVLTGTSALTAIANGEPLDADARYALEDGFTLEDLNLAWSNLNANVRAAKPSNGDLVANFSIKGPLDVLNQSQGRINATGVYENDKVDITAQLANVAFGATRIDNLNARVTGTPDDAAFDVKTGGQTPLNSLDTPFTLALNGRAVNEDNIRRITSSVSGDLAGRTLQSNQPVELELGDAIRINASLSALGGGIDLSGFIRQEDIAAKVNIENVNLNELASFAGRDDATGRISLIADWNGQGENGTGAFSATLSDIGRIREDAEKIELDIVGEITPNTDQNAARNTDQDTSQNSTSIFTGNFGPHKLTANINANSANGLKLSGKTAAGITISNGLPTLNQRVPMAIDVTGDGELAALWSLIGVETIDLSGQFHVEARDKALISELRPVGVFTLRDGSFEHETLGAHLRGLDLEADFDDEQVNLSSLSARGAHGGTLSGEGILHFDTQKASSVSFKFAEFVALKRSGMEVQLSGPLSAEKEPKGVSITGDLNIDRASVDVSSFGSSGVETVDVTFKDPEVENDDGAEEEEDRVPVLLDISLSAANRIFVTGKGLDIELSADAHIGGDINEPDVRGRADIVRGGFSFLSRQFRFSSGRVDLGSTAAQTRVNLEARQASDGITTILNVTGPVDDLEIGFSSSPQLPEDEVISRMLFGRSPSELTALEAAQLAAAAASLSGSGGFTPLGQIQDELGLDRLAISQDSEGAPELATGKYLSEDVYLELRSRASGNADLAVEWEPVDNVEVGTTFGGEGDARVSIQWKKDLP